MKTQLKYKDKIIPGYFIDENGIIYDSENNIQETVIGRGRPNFKCKSVHCLVVHSFIGYKKGFDIHHLNENKLDNRLSNLIYLTRSEHISLHNSSRAISQKTKQKISGTLKGHTPWNKGKKLSEETKQKLSKTFKENPSCKGKVWINNGIISKRVSTDNIPAGFVKGRI